MLTNLIPITEIPPRFSRDSIELILDRVNDVHSELSRANAEKYVSTLLGVKTVDDLIVDFEIFQELQPAISSSELIALATRVMSYTDGDMEKAIYSVRNVLNTLPKSVDDLIHYVPKERINQFIENVKSQSISIACATYERTGNEISTIDDLSEAMKDELSIVVDLICNNEMDEARKQPMENNPGVTERQRMLYAAANYYLNHKIGFKCNTVWLACFINSKVFGCHQGWLHSYNESCNSTHFGFKDEPGYLKLILNSLEFIKDYLTQFSSQKDHEGEDAYRLYIDTLIYTLESLIKLNAQDIKLDDFEIKDEMKKVNEILIMNELNMNDDQLILWKRIGIINRDDANYTQDEFDSIEEYVYKKSRLEQEPIKAAYPIFDAWNFFVFDTENTKTMLSPKFLMTSISPYYLNEFSDELLVHLKDMQSDNPHKPMFLGFFDNYLRMLINENSESHFLFDSIYDISLKLKSVIELDYMSNIELMAGLGHKRSMILKMENSDSKEEVHYWKERIKFLS